MKKTLKSLHKAVAVVLAASLCTGSLVACGGGNGGKEYTISFNTNGGNELSSVTFKVDDNVSLPVPEKAGYTFAGWYSNEMLTGNPAFNIRGATSGDKEFWAKWTEAEYTISFKDGKRTLRAQSDWITKYKDADATVAIPLPASADKKGYQFVGWYNNEALTGEAVTELPAGSTGNKTFYSKWDLVEYNIQFVTGIDGYTMEPKVYTTDKNLLLDEPDGTKAPYSNFDGWYETQDFSTRKLSQLTRGGAGDKTLYAKWRGKEYDITYNLNGGEFKTEYPEYHVYGEKTELVAPQKAGNTFTGWYNTAELTGSPVSTIEAPKHEATTLYASYKAVDHSITYETNGGIIKGVYPQGFNKGESVTLVNPVKDGYSFGGWYDNADFTGTAVTKISGKSENVKLYAKWVEGSYTINYVLNGGELGGDQTVNYTVTDTVSLISSRNTPKRTGYRFDGWYNNASFTGAVVKNIPAGSTGDKTFYAKWTIETYKLTYNLFGGSYPGTINTTVEFTVEDEVKLYTQEPTRNGYTFKGWYTDSSGTTAAQDIAKGTTGNKTVYAKWEANKYTITYDAKGGTMPTDYVKEYVTDSDTIWLPVPTLAGKVFGGWYEDANTTTPNVDKVIGSLDAKDYGNKSLTALWLDNVLPSTQTQLMEAEHTDLTGKTGPGGSGSAAEGNMISTEFPDASGGQSIPWTRGPGVAIDWEFKLDRAVTNASVKVRFGNELGGTKTFDNKAVSIDINGVLYTKPFSVTIADRAFGEFTITDIPLRAGYNVITITVLENDLAVGFDAGGPIFDCITVNAPATIGYKPIIWKEN